MKKIILYALVAIASMTSCTKMDNTSSNVQYVYLLTSYETKLVNAPLRKMEFAYSEDYMTAPTTANLNYQFTYTPIMRVQEIAGDTIAKIEYQYPTEDDLKITTTSMTGTRVENYTLNAQKMASMPTPTPFNKDHNISYEGDGFRTKVGEYLTLNSNGLYTQVDSLGQAIVKYNYTNIYNTFGLQQHNIYGSPYNWPTGRFGKQSLFLLDKVTRIENGTQVVYDYTYLFDSNGFVQKETITRDQKEYMVNTYSYAMGTITYK